MNDRKCVRLQSHFINYGSKLNAIQNLQKPITSKKDSTINVFCYFHACPQASIRSAEDHLTHGLLHRILLSHDMHPYKFTKIQALKSEGYQNRIQLFWNHSGLHPIRTFFYKEKYLDRQSSIFQGRYFR